MKPKKGEVLVLLIGIILLLANFFLIKIPPTLRRVNILESYILKGAIFLIALFLIIFSVISLLSKNSFIFNPKTKKIAASIFITLSLVIICLFLLEGFLQLTSQKSCQQQDPILHNSYRPNCFIRSKTMEWDITAQINSQGLRDEEVLAKENYEYRILVLGDSLPAGWGVEHNQTYSEILQQKLNQEKKVDVLNAAVTGYSPILEYLYLREKGLEYEPDIIILNVDMGDIQGDNHYSKLAKIDEEGRIIGVPQTEDSILMSLYKKSKVVKLLEVPLIILDAKIEPYVWGSEHFYELDYDSYMLTRGDIDQKEAEEYFATVFKHIKLIQELSEEKGIKLIITTYPYGHQVSGDEWAKGRHNYGFENGKVYSDLPNKILEEFAEENNITFISMFKDFKESEAFPLYFPYDGHFNEEGHELAAEVLFNEIVGMDLFEEKTELLVKRENNSYWKANGNILYNKTIIKS